MTDELSPTSEEKVEPAGDPALLDEIVPDVSFVVPATAYDSIDTDDELTRPPAAEAARPAEAAPKTLEAITALGDSLHRKLDGLQTLFDREIRAEATREKVVDRLHAELQEYKQDLLLNVLRPVFVDLIQLHDDIGKIAEAKRDPAPEAAELRLLELMRGFQQGIEDILYRQGVEPFLEAGESFDPRRQRAVSTVPTEDPTASKKIAARLRKGFRAGDKVIRPEIVSVFAFKK